MRMLDLFCGRWGWSRAFAARGWECVGVDLVEPPEIPQMCQFVKADILMLTDGYVPLAPNLGFRELSEFDFICASSPCEQFSVHGMKHFHPNPPYPELGIKLFEHTRALCEASSVPYVMENVRAAQQFVGQAVHHCGPFYLWGSGVPPLMNQGIVKGKSFRAAPGAYMEKRPAGVSIQEWRNRWQLEVEALAMGVGGGNGGEFAKLIPAERKEWRKRYQILSAGSRSSARKVMTAAAATIPPELASCVADYAERICGVPV